MLLNGIKLTILIGVLVSLVVLSCKSTKGGQSANDHEAAANLLMNHSGLSDFEAVEGSPAASRYIVIALKSGNMTGRGKETKMVYDKSMKKWTGSYKSENKSGRAGPNETDIIRENLTPKSGWLPLMKTLTEKNIHTIRDSKSIEYKQLVADGVYYVLEIRIGDKQRKYGFSNPSIYAKHYTDITDFADFDSIVETLRTAFPPEG